MSSNLADSTAGLADVAARSALKARVELLRSQLDPDFLFNTLNSLSGLIHARRHADADQLIGSLAHYLRAPSAAEEPSFIALEREMGIARAFLEIEAVRMGHRFSLDITCPAELATIQMPCLILLPLVNAATLAGREAVSACETISLSVRDAGSDVIVSLGVRFSRPSEAGIAEFHNGISPLTERLALLYGSADRLKVDLDAASIVAYLRLPTT